jgi:prepilin-type N-terminal cleavage/methylation domain-containing protein
MSKKNGFTLVELLVVIAIIGILVGMLFPAIQAVREAARRTECSNNIRQLAIATHNYESAFKKYPKAGVVDYSTSPETYYHGILTTLLPYLEQNNVYDNIFLQLPFDAPENIQPPTGTNPVGPYSTKIGSYLCPTSTGRGTVSYHDTGELTIDDEIFFGTTDYAAVRGIGGDFATELGITGGEVGAFTVIDPATRHSDMRDGTSNTIFFIEDAARPDLYIGNQLQPSTYALGSAWADLRSNSISVDGLSGNGTCVVGCTNDSEIYSFHGTGYNAALGDASTHFIASQVDPIVLAQYITRRGGEVSTKGLTD